jgi:phosphoribosylformylglycinamidine cyclo-ligase
VLPEGLGVRIASAWPRPPIFDLIAQGGPVDEGEMRRAFNLGVGFVFIVAATDATDARAALAREGDTAVELGTVITLPGDTPFEERVVWPDAR